MKLNFYSKLIIVLITMIPHCFSTALSDVDTSKFNSVTARKESASVAAGRSLIQDADEARCVQYNKSPGGFKEYRLHTAKIDHFLANAHVKEDEAASDEMIRAIVTAAIDKEITHYGDKSLKRTHSPVKAKRDELGEGHRFYNHYHVLSLIEDAAALFVKGKTNIFTSYKYELFSNNSYKYELISNNADSIYAQIERINSRINKQVFTDCLSITYKNHKRGIAAVKRKAEIDKAVASCGDSARMPSTHAEGSVTTLKKAHPAAEAKVKAPPVADKEETAPVDTGKAAALSAASTTSLFPPAEVVAEGKKESAITPKKAPVADKEETAPVDTGKAAALSPASATRLLPPTEVIAEGKDTDTVGGATNEKSLQAKLLKEDDTLINPGVFAEEAATSELVTETNPEVVADHIHAQELLVEEVVVESKADSGEEAVLTATNTEVLAEEEGTVVTENSAVAAEEEGTAAVVEDEDTKRLREAAEEQSREAAEKLAKAKEIVAKGEPQKVDQPSQLTICRTNFTKKNLPQNLKEVAGREGISQAEYAKALNAQNESKNIAEKARFAKEKAAYDQYSQELTEFQAAKAITDDLT